jgi:hypothetical protein
VSILRTHLGIGPEEVGSDSDEALFGQFVAGRYGLIPSSLIFDWSVWRELSSSWRLRLATERALLFPPLTHCAPVVYLNIDSRALNPAFGSKRS